MTELTDDKLNQTSYCLNLHLNCSLVQNSRIVWSLDWFKGPILMTKYKCKSVMSGKSSYLHHFLDDCIIRGPPICLHLVTADRCLFSECCHDVYHEPGVTHRHVSHMFTECVLMGKYSFSVFNINREADHSLSSNINPTDINHTSTNLIETIVDIQNKISL